MAYEDFVKKIRQGEKLGGGGEKAVYVHPHKPEHVVGVYKKDDEIPSPEELRKIFFATKIAHLLFPKNIPDVHMVTSDPPTIERTRVEGTRLSQDPLADYDFEDVLRAFLDAGVMIDGDTGNFVRDRNNNIVYLDNVEVGTHPLFDNWQRLEDAIQSRLSGDQQTKALGYLRKIAPPKS